MESSRMTTSRLCSTSRLAFSITISATCTCRAAGSSKVDEITSPLTERCMSVTSSGRSSMGRTNLAADGVTGLEIELADLRGRDIDVIGPGKVVVIGRAEKAIAVRQNFEHAFGEDVAFFFALRLEDLKDQILLAQTAGPGQIQRSGDLGQLGNILFFEFSDGH